jgi:hypothetical protein
MQNSLLIRTLRRLNEKEIRAVGQFTTCEYFNRRPEVARLFALLTAHFQKKNPRTLADEAVFAAVFPAEKYDNQRLRNAMSGLLEIIRRALIVFEVENDRPTRNFHLVRGLRQRNLDDLFEKDAESAAAELEKTADRDARWHLHEYQLRQESLETTARTQRGSRLDLRPLHTHLTAFYLSEMLRNGCAALTHQAISAQEYDRSLIESALDLAASGDWLATHPLIALYFHICRALLEPENPAHFTAWQAVLVENTDHLPPSEGRIILLAGINFCIRRMNRGEKQYIRAAFDLFQLALQKNLLEENGWLTGFTYKNIIRIGTALGEHTWVADFFETAKTRLHPREREPLFRYNKAYLFFQKNDFVRAMPMLQSLELEDRLNLLDARRMLLRIYVELGEWDALDALLSSFSAYLKRQDDLGYHRNLYQNLVKFLRKWSEIRLAPDHARAIIFLKKEIEATEDVAEKAWILEKISQK